MRITVHADAQAEQLTATGESRESEFKGDRSTDLNGRPLSEVEAFRKVESFGTIKTEVVTIRIPAQVAPKVRSGEALSFTGLTATVDTTSGRCFWAAEALVQKAAGS